MHHFLDIGAGVVQFANFFLEQIKGWQTYSRLREGIPLDCSCCKERKFIEVPMCMELTGSLGGSNFWTSMFYSSEKPLIYVRSLVTKQNKI